MDSVVDYIIRPLYPEEIHLLRDFLYEAIFIPEGVEPLPRDVVDLPELKLYIQDFGKKQDDCCLVVEYDGKVVGAVWTRIMNDYGHVDDETPSLSISLYKCLSLITIISILSLANNFLSSFIYLPALLIL